jgi:hypothetical protein
MNNDSPSAISRLTDTQRRWILARPLKRVSILSYWNGRYQVSSQLWCSITVFLFWRIGQQVTSEILYHRRAEYGQKIVTTLPTRLVASYGCSFESRNLRRMMQFAEQFPDFGIVSPLATQLNWGARC